MRTCPAASNAASPVSPFPALLFTTVARADLHAIFSVVLVTNLASLFVVQLVRGCLSR